MLRTSWPEQLFEMHSFLDDRGFLLCSFLGQPTLSQKLHMLVRFKKECTSDDGSISDLEMYARWCSYPDNTHQTDCNKFFIFMCIGREHFLDFGNIATVSFLIRVSHVHRLSGLMLSPV